MKVIHWITQTSATKANYGVKWVEIQMEQKASVCVSYGIDKGGKSNERERSLETHTHKKTMNRKNLRKLPQTYEVEYYTGWFAAATAGRTANVQHVADDIVVASNSTKLIHSYSIFIYSFHPIHTENSLT